MMQYGAALIWVILVETVRREADPTRDANECPSQSNFRTVVYLKRNVGERCLMMVIDLPKRLNRGC